MKLFFDSHTGCFFFFFLLSLLLFSGLPGYQGCSYCRVSCGSFLIGFGAFGGEKSRVYGLDGSVWRL